MMHLNFPANFLNLLFIIVLFSGCASNLPYYTGKWSEGNCVGDAASEACQGSYYQEYDGFDLAFAEYSERGNAFSDVRLTHLLQRIEARARDKGVVVVTFVHGWKHNASEDDTNLKDFKDTLRVIASCGDLGDRRLVGVYVGWRGSNLGVKGLENITFWDRKAVAEEVGKGGVSRLFLELERIDGMRPGNGPADKNVLVLIGHSFGGAIVVRAVSEILVSRLVARGPDGALVKPVGDGVFLLNPAIEANQTLHLVETALGEQARSYGRSQGPLLISLSSEADWATHYLFPLGQTVGLLATWKQADLERRYYQDRRHPGETPPALKEEHLDTTTTGNFAPFLTEYLSASPSEDEAGLALRACASVPSVCEPAGFTSLEGQPAIDPKQIPTGYPLHFIRTDANVMSGHNDIFNSKVHAFLLAMVDDVIRRAWPAGKPVIRPFILSDPARLSAASGRFFERLRALRSGGRCRP